MNIVRRVSIVVAVAIAAVFSAAGPAPAEEICVITQNWWDPLNLGINGERCFPAP